MRHVNYISYLDVLTKIHTNELEDFIFLYTLYKISSEFKKKKLLVILYYYKLTYFISGNRERNEIIKETLHIQKHAYIYM